MTGDQPHKKTVLLQKKMTILGFEQYGFGFKCVMCNFRTERVYPAMKHRRTHTSLDKFYGKITL